jgi:tetratricopeptide (TPR) repeat protein
MKAWGCFMGNEKLESVAHFRQFANASRNLCQALSLSRQNENSELLAAIYSALADFPDSVLEDDELIGILDALAADNIPTKQGIAEPLTRFLLTLGFAHVRLYERSGARGSLERALSISDSALLLISREAFPRLWAFAHVLAGDSKRLLFEMSGDVALEHYREAVDAIRRGDDPTAWAEVANRLGREYQIRVAGDKVENLRRAAELFEVIERIWEEAGSVWNVAKSRVALADVRVALNRDDQDLRVAVAYYRHAFNLFERIGDRRSTEVLAEKIRFLETVNFSAYYPRTVFIGNRYSLVIYAHLPELQREVHLDAQKFSAELGAAVPTPRQSRNTTKLERDTLVTMVPECPQIRFDPPELIKRWDGNWTRFLFDFEMNRELIGEVLLVQISIQVAGIEIASIRNCAIEVTESAASQVRRAPTDHARKNPLPDAELATKTSALYQKIFVSYSRRDREVTEKYKVAQVALGNDTFIDVDNLRAGEDWRAALARAIDQADVFQLFWSFNSASSEHCRYEWMYALQVRCPDGHCEGFIRPVFWQKPMPDPPPELKDLNFRYAPLAGEMKLADQSG